MEPITLGLVVRTKSLWDELQPVLSKLTVRVVLERPDVSDWATFLDQLERLAPDIVLLDLSTITGASETVEGAIRKIRASAVSPTVVALHTSPDPERILESMRAGASEFLFPPLEQGLSAALQRLGGDRARQRGPVRTGGRIYGFLSAKGGCGATTVACHVAVELQRLLQSSTLLVDLDLDAGMVGFVMKAKNTYSVVDAARNVYRLDASFWRALVSNGRPGLEVMRAPDPGTSKELPRPEQLRHILRFARSNYKSTIVDLGRGLNIFSLSALEEVDEVYIVTMLEVPALHQTKQIIQNIQSTGYGRDRMHLLLNRAPKRPEITQEELEKSMGLPIYMPLPNDYAALYDSYAEGTLLSPNSPLARQFAALAARIAGVEEEKKKGKFSLFG